MGNLPESLLSRFDLLFIMADKPSKSKDNKIAHHILTMRSLSETMFTRKSTTCDIRDQVHITEKSNYTKGDTEDLDQERKFFIPKNKVPSTCIQRLKQLKPIFVRKLVTYIRKRPVAPKQISLDAQERIITFYTNLRSHHRDESGLPI